MKKIIMQMLALILVLSLGINYYLWNHYNYANEQMVNLDSRLNEVTANPCHNDNINMHISKVNEAPSLNLSVTESAKVAILIALKNLESKVLNFEPYIAQLTTLKQLIPEDHLLATEILNLEAGAGLVSIAEIKKSLFNSFQVNKISEHVEDSKFLSSVVNKVIKIESNANPKKVIKDYDMYYDQIINFLDSNQLPQAYNFINQNESNLTLIDNNMIKKIKSELMNIIQVKETLNTLWERYSLLTVIITPTSSITPIKSDNHDAIQKDGDK